MRGKIPYAPLSLVEPPSPCRTLYFNSDAGSPGPLIFAPPPIKLTDPVHSIPRDFKEAAAEWLHQNGPWGLWCHLTVGNPNILEKTTHHHYMRWIRGMDEEIFGRRYREKGLGVTFARATEHQQNGRIHYHVLISEEALQLRRLDYKDYWEYGFPGASTSYGDGHARVYKYDRRLAGKAERYVMKYVTKERDIFLYRPSVVGQEPSSK